MDKLSSLAWWQKAVFYQIYPRSFADGTGDGIGDLPGLIARLDYLRDLGVDALWLSPHYPSPQIDCGYDVSDYTGVAPEYGTLDDFKLFLQGAHARGIRVILDFVLNHTSDQHAWFLAARAGRDAPTRDWYVWRDGVNGGPPNNWLSAFGGSAWEYDAASGQYYYHFFFKEQPDLNWRNPAVKAAMFAAARFWLDLGVDGFRLDAINTIYEDPALRDHSATYTQADLHRAWRLAKNDAEHLALRAEWKRMYEHQTEQPGVHELMQELRAVVDAYPERVLIGENDEPSYHGDGSNELHMVFNFPLMRAGRLTPAIVRANQAERLAELPPGAWPCNTLGNHDSSRLYTRYSRHTDDPAEQAALARLALALMLTLRGTPFLYNGEEIGMTDWPMQRFDQFRDRLAVWRYRLELDELGSEPALALDYANEHGRDKCRTPQQWANAVHGGFCPPEVEPWLPVNPNYAAGVNVAEQTADPASLHNFYRGLLTLRRATPALIAGDYAPASDSADVLAFTRRSAEQACLVALNFSAQPQTVALDLKDAAKDVTLTPIYSSASRVEVGNTVGALTLAPFEILIAELTSEEE